jgi:oxygen-independent coproporphyrinogen-3 oxidase
MLELTQAHAHQSGYDRCAVWSWLKPEKKKFSSITRHHYVGFGPSAASMTGTDFYVNTFDVRAYSASLPKKRPIAPSMPVDRRLEMAYWLYWRVYELKILDIDFQELFGTSLSLDSVFSNVLRPFRLAGMIGKKNGGYYVTESGAYWIHRLQNEYSLNYINRLWGSCRREAWPAEVFL